MNVSLREITAETVRKITSLVVAPSQERFVASNAISLAEALLSPEAWYRAIYLDDAPVGFVMLYDETFQSPPPTEPQIAIWRFMVDARFQGQGIGREALEQIVAHAQSIRVFSSLLVSYVPGSGSPESFYKNFGFLPTGEIDDGEIVLELSFWRR